jgi:hypothetical protein
MLRSTAHDSSHGTIPPASKFTRHDRALTRLVRRVTLPPLVLCLSVIVIYAILFAAILRLNHGTFSYIVDDCYIELRMGQNLHHFHYGINAGELSSPASSILYPMLLAPAAASSYYEFVPLFINLICLLASGLMIAKLLERSGLESATAYNAALVILICYNLIAVAFTGMEHSLQTMLALAVLLAVTAPGDWRSQRGWLAAVLLVGPFVRFEALAVSGACLVVLWLRGHRTYAAAIAATLSILLAAFCFTMWRAGLPIMPSSVQVKSAVVAQATQHPLHVTQLVWLLTLNFLQNVQTLNGLLLLVLAYFLAVKLLVEGMDKRLRVTWR